ncbi:hypothetical protein GINT2_000664 [Glugoides intestinalis]
MIIGDENKKLLLTEEGILVARRNSTIKYDNIYSKEVLETVLDHPKSFKDKIYNYEKNKLISFQTSAYKDVSVTDVIDFYKLGKTFFFVKKAGKKGLSLCTLEGDLLLEFNSPYCFDSNFIFYLRNGTFQKFDLLTQEREKMNKINSQVVTLCFQASEDASNDTFAYADVSNKINIFNNNKHRMYHWMSKEIYSLRVHERFVVAVSKSGVIAKFHIDIQKVEPILQFNGSFVDLEFKGSLMFVLTSFEFFVFDLTTNNTIFKDIHVGIATFCKSNLSVFSENDDKDIFNRKKQSSISILNLLPKPNQDRKNILAVTYIFEGHLFAFDTELQAFTGLFKLENTANAFISGEYCISFLQRKSSVIVNIYSIFFDRLVLKKTTSFSWKERLDISNVFLLNMRVYLVLSGKLYLINMLGTLEKTNITVENKVLKQTQKFLYLIDENGILNLTTRKYEVKQKRVMNFTVIDDKLVFYIDDKGIYMDLQERDLIFDLKNVIDIESRKVSVDNKEKDVVEILYLKNGHYFVGMFDFDGGKLTMLREIQVDNQSSRILIGKVCTTRTQLLMI